MKIFIKSLLTALLFWTASANATLFSVEYSYTGGYNWEGVVDTTTDTLTITSWVEETGGAYEWWTPTTSLVFSALSSSGAYDIADDWDGTIGSTWGFISDLTKDVISWNEGTFLGNDSSLGWGVRIVNDGGINYGYDETWFGYVPRGEYQNTFVTSSLINVSVSLITSDDNTTAQVPVPAPFALMGLGLIALGLTRKKFA